MSYLDGKYKEFAIKQKMKRSRRIGGATTFLLITKGHIRYRLGLNVASAYQTISYIDGKYKECAIKQKMKRNRGRGGATK